MLDPSRWSNVPLQDRLVMTDMSGDDKWCQLLQQDISLLISHSQLRDQSFFLAIITLTYLTFLDICSSLLCSYHKKICIPL